jgi:hypothetical protein
MKPDLGAFRGLLSSITPEPGKSGGGREIIDYSWFPSSRWGTRYYLISNDN